ncbi:MAG TPA: hypothetical protein PK649_04295, partial [Vicingus sp.]|nr:hypothetical protein [Vicingus sp.]
MIVNGTRNATLNGFNVNTSGYVGIGNPNYSPLVGGGPIWSTQGPFSLLHLNGDGGGQENGFRPWMQTGITLTENFDLAYVGNRIVDGVGDRNEFTMAWSNDPTSTQFGPDDMVFRFLSGRALGAAGSTINSDFSVPNDLDGRHIARFTGNGELGLGNTFGLMQSGVGYIRPQSLLHMSLYQTSPVWLQMTNQTGTGQTVTDGLRIGITTTGTAHINQQENLPLIFYTGAVEDARIVPAAASTLSGNHGMIGVGNFSAPAFPIDAKLDIDGDLRIRTVTQDNTLTRVLVIDPTDQNRVHWRDVSSIGGGGTGGTVTANNGLSILPASNVQLGGSLIKHTTVDMNNFQMYFSNQGRFYIGGTGNSKLVVKNDATPWAHIAMFNSNTGSNRMKIADNGQTVFDMENSGTQAILFNTAVSGSGWNTNGNFVTTATSGAADGGGVVGVGSTINGNTIAPHFAFSSTPHNFTG